MFSLIITIISIALVAALAVATLYYGGSAWSDGQVNAQAGTLLNQAQQIAGAVEIFRAQTGQWPTAIGDLTTNGEYLRNLPTPVATSSAWALSTGATAATLTGINTEVCEKIDDRNLGDVVCTGGTMTFPIRSGS